MFLREATADDLQVLTSLRLAFLAENRDTDPSTFSTAFVTATRHFFERHGEAGTSRSWVASDEGADIGIVTMLVLDLAPRPEDASGREGYIVNMYVERARRGQGVGRSLLDQCLRAASQMSLRRLLLHATVDGRPLYASAGFTSNSNWMELQL